MATDTTKPNEMAHDVPEVGRFILSRPRQDNWNKINTLNVSYLMAWDSRYSPDNPSYRPHATIIDLAYSRAVIEAVSTTLPPDFKWDEVYNLQGLVAMVAEWEKWVQSFPTGVGGLQAANPPASP